MVVNRRIRVETTGECDVIDITLLVQKEIDGAGVGSGVAAIFVTGSTAGLTTMEYEGGLVSDFSDTWDRIVPSGVPYHHDRRWGDGNGHSHVRASMLGPSLVVPFVDRRMTLGTWQQIVLADFDIRRRSREVVVQIMGE